MSVQRMDGVTQPLLRTITGMHADTGSDDDGLPAAVHAMLSPWHSFAWSVFLTTDETGLHRVTGLPAPPNLAFFTHNLGNLCVA